MKISYNWLGEYVDGDVPSDEVAETLTMGGLEVEDVERIGGALEGVVVGHVLETRRHPNADRLTLCSVDVGAADPVQIACGAPNVEAGQKVPVATVGTSLDLPSRDAPATRSRITIRKAKIRGEISEGMICAEDELGLSDDHSGIMVLPADAPVGEPLDWYLAAQGVPASDLVFDIAITPNRPDAASHIGVARDVAALTGGMLRIPGVRLPDHGGETAEVVRVDIRAPEACPRYVAMLVRHVTVGESPQWLKRRLTAIGLRPRNAIVDITNYVLHECGQPLHAFDFDLIAGETVRVRLSDQETTFTTLDGKERKVPAGTLMIADAERDIAIAGVMGGENSEVTERTKDVLIESAYFDPSAIRRAAKTLGLQTDASYRFERGVDRDGQVWAAARAAALMTELAGGKVVPGLVDAHPIPYETRTVRVRMSRVRGLLGVDVPAEEARALLSSIGFTVQREEGEGQGGSSQAISAGESSKDGDFVPENDDIVFSCTVPSFRPDVEREVDVIEEIVRLYGFDRIPEPARAVAPGRPPRELPDDRLRRSARALLAGMGYREIYTNSMLRRDVAARFGRQTVAGAAGDGDVVETLNPISREMAVLRPSLLPGLLQVMSFNFKHGRRLLRFFEFGHIFEQSGRPDTTIPGFAEHESFLLGASGPYFPMGWDVTDRTIDLFDVRGAVETLLESLRVPDLDFVPHYAVTEITNHHLEVYSGTTRLGSIARLSNELASDFDLKDPVYFAEIDWQTAVALAAPLLVRSYQAVSRYPVVERDIAVVVNRDQPAGAMMKLIRRQGSDLLRQVDLFDLYEGDHVGAGKKSIAFALRFAADRTLQDEEVDAEVESIVNRLREEYGAELRS